MTADHRTERLPCASSCIQKAGRTATRTTKITTKVARQAVRRSAPVDWIALRCVAAGCSGELRGSAPRNGMACARVSSWSKSLDRSAVAVLVDDLRSARAHVGAPTMLAESAGMPDRAERGVLASMTEFCRLYSACAGWAGPSLAVPAARVPAAVAPLVPSPAAVTELIKSAMTNWSTTRWLRTNLVRVAITVDDSASGCAPARDARP
jgi:hypothetical protein